MKSRPESEYPALRTNTARFHLILTVCLATLPITACEKKEAPSQLPPPEVEVTEVVQRDVPIYQEYVAQLNGPINAEITPKVQGYLLKQNYQNGFFVKKGQLLFEIDPRPFVASLDQAKAQVAVAEAQLSNAQTNVSRDTPLVAQNAIPRKQLDNDRAMLAANQAQLDATKAQLVQAQLNLAWTKVYSPIDGIAGNATSQIGELVGPTTKMMTVSRVNPIWAYFNISEVAYLANASKIAPLLREGRVSRTLFRSNTFRQTMFPTSIRAASFSLAARSLRRRERCSWPPSFPIKREFYVQADSAGFAS